MDELMLFSRRLLILTVFVEALYIGCMYLLPPNYVSHATPVIPLLFASMTFIIHKFLVNSDGTAHKKFMQRFMIASSAKLIIMLIMVVIYSLIRSEDAIQFVLYFFFSYLAFTIFEARLLTKLKS